jgi:hypothetical protein
MAVVDKSSLVRRARNEKILAGVDPLVATRVRSWLARCESHHVSGILLTCGRRTWTEQAMVYGHGRSAQDLRHIGVDPRFARPGMRIVTKAKPGTSMHEMGYAVDWNAWEYSDLEQRVAARMAHECGLESGYNWAMRDGCHLQLPDSARKGVR